MDANCNGKPIIIDAGTGLCKAGFAGDALPRVVFPTNLELDQEKDMIKRDKTRGRGISCAGEPCKRSPTNKGTVTKDAIRHILKQALYDELHVDPKQHAVLFVDSPLNSRDLREEIFRALFQDFNVPACCLCSQPILSLHAQGQKTGVVIDSGHGSTYIAPVHDGKVIQSAVKQVPVSGRELDSSLALLLRKRGYAFISPQEQHALREIKEKQCYISLDPDHELETSANRFFVEKRAELPDGEIITLQTETFSCPEALFKPSNERTDAGIQGALIDSINCSPSDIREMLYNNIILSGGTTMFSGFGPRLSKTISEIAPPGTKFNIVEPPDRKYSAWIGGSMFANRNDFLGKLLSKDKCDALGPAEVISRGLGIIS